MKLRNSPAITRVPCLESEHFNHNLFDPDLIRDSLGTDEIRNSLTMTNYNFYTNYNSTTGD